MSQTFQKINLTDKVADSLSKILERDNAAATGFAGVNDPQSIEDWMLGLISLRLDLKQLRCLTSIDPVTWTTMVDFSRETPSIEFVEDNYQPLNDVLTKFSQISLLANRIPYFESNNSMALLPITSLSRQLMAAEDAATVRNLLELGSLSTVDRVTSDNIDSVLENGSITLNKLTFTPISKGECYTTGDIKETFNDTIDDGWILLRDDDSIGSSNSVGTHKGNDYQALYYKLWVCESVSMKDSNGNATAKGSTASQDWSANKALVLPKYVNYWNPTAIYKIRL